MLSLVEFLLGKYAEMDSNVRSMKFILPALCCYVNNISGRIDHCGGINITYCKRTMTIGKRKTNIGGFPIFL